MVLSGSVSSASPELLRGRGVPSGTAALVPRSDSQGGGSAAADEGRRLLGEEEPREARLRPVRAVERSLQTLPHSEQRCKHIQRTQTGSDPRELTKGFPCVPVEYVSFGWRELPHHPTADPPVPNIRATHHKEV